MPLVNYRFVLPFRVRDVYLPTRSARFIAHTNSAERPIYNEVYRSPTLIGIHDISHVAGKRCRAVDEHRLNVFT